MRSHFLGEDPPDPLTVGNSPKARHRAGVIADQKTTRGKTGENGNHIYMLTQQSGVLRKKTCNRKSKANTIKEKGAEKDIKHVQLLLFIVKKIS